MAKTGVLVLNFKDEYVDFGRSSEMSRKYFNDSKLLGVSFRSMGKNIIFNRPLNKKFLRVIL